MTYINPYLSDEEFVGRDTRLSRQRSRDAYLEASREGGVDAALNASKHGETASLRDGFLPIPGASRSGALDPQTRSRMLRQERDGLIELQRSGSGHLLGYRPINRMEE